MSKNNSTTMLTGEHQVQQRRSTRLSSPQEAEEPTPELIVKDYILDKRKALSKLAKTCNNLKKSIVEKEGGNIRIHLSTTLYDVIRTAAMNSIRLPTKTHANRNCKYIQHVDLEGKCAG